MSNCNKKRQFKSPRYREGSRRKPRNVIAIGTHRKQPDLAKFGRAVIRAAMQQAQAEIDAKNHNEQRRDHA